MSDEPSQPERRKVGRVRKNASYVSFTAGPSEIAIGQIYDFSVVGIGILTRRYLVPRAAIRIHIPAFENNPLRYLSAEVRHATAQNGGQWLLGCSLSRPLTCTEVLAFG